MKWLIDSFVLKYSQPFEIQALCEPTDAIIFLIKFQIYTRLASQAMLNGELPQAITINYIANMISIHAIIKHSSKGMM